jgi:transposase
MERKQEENCSTYLWLESALFFCDIYYIAQLFGTTKWWLGP